MIPKCRTFLFISSIIRYNGDKDLPSASSSDSESLLNILVSDSSVVVIDSSISYKNSVLAFLTAAIILKSLSYLILYSRYYFIFSF